jgi:hypothetical protein
MISTSALYHKIDLHTEANLATTYSTFTERSRVFHCYLGTTENELAGLSSTSRAAIEGIRRLFYNICNCGCVLVAGDQHVLHHDQVHIRKTEVDSIVCNQLMQRIVIFAEDSY